MVDAIRSSGGQVVEANAANGLVWLDVTDPDAVARLLDDHPNIEWVQLPWAGVEGFLASGLFERPATFTCAKGSYAEQVGEHLLVLTLACFRNLVAQARVRKWQPMEPGSLLGKRVTILGGGGIASTFIRLLQPFGCSITVLRRNPQEMEGVQRCLSIGELHAVLPNTDVLALALSLTPETTGIIGEAELALLPTTAVIANVSRGAHIDTEALVAALRERRVAAAGIDVTEPEPLPSDHPLWSMDNVLITSHCADAIDFVAEQLANRVRDNVARLIEGQPLIGVVDPVAGY